MRLNDNMRPKAGAFGRDGKIVDELLAQTVLRKEPFVEIVPSGWFVEQ